jgi:hypothetical protein
MELGKLLLKGNSESRWLFTFAAWASQVCDISIDN